MKQESVLSELQRYARKLWLAGLGVFGKVLKESVSLFEALVEEGKKVEAERGEATQTPVLAPLKALGDTLRDQAQELEERVEAQVARAMNRLGVPVTEDIQNLSRRVDEMQASVQAFIAAQKVVARKPEPRARKTAAEKVEEPA